MEVTQDILKYLSNEKKIQSNKLKKLLFLKNLKKKKCEICGIEEWCGYPAPLELHHIDGNHNNNSLSNLEILCPNCHALKPGFCNSSRKKKKSAEEYREAIETSTTISEVCIKLGLSPKGANYTTIKGHMEKYGLKLIQKTPIEKKRRSDQSPAKKRNKHKTLEDAVAAITIGKYPPDELLVNLVWEKSLLKLSKEIGVSDNAIRRFCKTRNILLPPVGYWRKIECKRTDECEAIKKKIFENWTGIKPVQHFRK